MGKSQPTWENDPTLTAPHDIYSKQTRTYKAILTYDIYEINDRSRQDGPADWSLAPTPIGRQSVSVDYTVVIAAKWVAD